MAKKPTSAKRKPRKPCTQMTAAQLQAATADFDKEFIADTFGPPSARQAEQLRRAKRKRGRHR